MCVCAAAIDNFFHLDDIKTARRALKIYQGFNEATGRINNLLAIIRAARISEEEIPDMKQVRYSLYTPPPAVCLPLPSPHA